jgi:hypothetical protein
MFVAARHDEQYGAERRFSLSEDVSHNSHLKEGRTNGTIA